MRYAIASDIHGSAHWCARMVRAIEDERVDKLILLGDLLYHGPRNALPEGYDPAAVAQQLNSLPVDVVAVRGNCDAEVDQMLLAFPCMADYALVVDEGTQLLCTHGHLDLDSTIGALPQGSVVLSGHTHVKRDEVVDGTRRLNPGSVSIPKDGSHSLLVYENGIAEFKLLS